AVRYRLPTVYVGLVIGPVTPRARQAPRTKTVFPTPSSPDTWTTSPTARTAATAAPRRSVSSALEEAQLRVFGLGLGNRRGRLAGDRRRRRRRGGHAGQELGQLREVGPQRVHH